MQTLVVVLIALSAFCFVSGEDTKDFTPTTCGCCPLPRCQNQAMECSTNNDCECLWMTMTGQGMCADTVISCSQLTSCESDNRTCSPPNTVCVNNTRCNRPVCYPLERANSESCPPRIFKGTTTTTPATITTPSPSTTTTTTPFLSTVTTRAPSPSTTTTTTPLLSTDTTRAPSPSITTTTTLSPSTTITTSPRAVTITTTTTINPCANTTRCLNNGTCQPSGSTFYCLCPPTHYGPVCEYLGKGADLTELEKILNGTMNNYDKTVESVLNRSNWTNIVAVVDVTGSMQPCAAAVYKWMKLSYDKLDAIKYYVFFNDGDRKADKDKVIGSTGGLYGIPTTDLDTVLSAMQTAMKNGNGGDEPENDVEAILYGIKQCPTCTSLIHIADNQATPRDLVLLPNVTMPVKVITCQLNSKPVNPALLNIASQTGGSLHTLEQDVVTLSGIPVGAAITIGKSTYRRTETGYVQVS